MVNPLLMAIFNSYVKLPEGNVGSSSHGLASSAAAVSPTSLENWSEELAANDSGQLVRWPLLLSRASLLVDARMSVLHSVAVTIVIFMSGYHIAVGNQRHLWEKDVGVGLVYHLPSHLQIDCSDCSFEASNPISGPKSPVGFPPRLPGNQA